MRRAKAPALPKQPNDIPRWLRWFPLLRRLALNRYEIATDLAIYLRYHVVPDFDRRGRTVLAHHLTAPEIEQVIVVRRSALRLRIEVSNSCGDAISTRVEQFLRTELTWPQRLLTGRIDHFVGGYIMNIPET